MKMKKILSISLLCLIVAQPVNATLITITDPGSSFDLTYDDALLGLFGTPSLINNNITFTPTVFKAEAIGVAPGVTDITSSTVGLTLNIKKGNQFSAINLIERGDYKLNSIGFASVDVGGQIRVHDITDPIGSEATDFIVETSGPYINDNNFHNWEAAAGVDATDSDWYLGETVKLTIENVLTAQALGFPDLAFIEKKLLSTPISLEVVTVPLPSAFILFSAGLLYLLPGAARRRK